MEEQIAVLEVFLVLCASNYFRHFFLLNLYKTHANLQVICILWLTGFIPPKQYIWGNALLCIVRTFRPSSRWFLLYSFYWFLFPVHQMIFRHAFLIHNIPLQVIYTLSFYKCLRTTYYNANLPYLDAGNVNVGWSHVLWDKRSKV